MIEYTEGGGFKGESWNPSTGCLHGVDICPVSADCWARKLSRQFKHICRGDFQPRFHEDRLTLPRSWQKPRRVATCFMADLFGDWPNADDTASGGRIEMGLVRTLILHEVALCPQHQFLFLTKNPPMLAAYNPWPKNAQVGITLTGAESPARQRTMLEALGHVRGAGVRWLSYEPAIAPLAVLIPSWLSWCVIGGWSGKYHPLSIEGRKGVENAVLECEARHIPRWEKENLSRVIEAPLHQELP